MSRRLFLPAALLGGVAVFAAVFFVALGMRAVVAGPDSGPAASPPNPGHSWSEIGDFPGTMWHSNNDGSGSGLDADTLDGLESTEIQDADDYVGSAGDADTVDGLHANEIHDADDYVSNAGYATAAGDADTVDGAEASALEESAEIDADIAAHAADAGAHHTKTTDASEIVSGTMAPERIEGTAWTSANDGAGSGLDADTLDGLDSSAFSTGPHTTSLPWSSITTKPAGFADDTDDDILGGLSCASGEIAKWDGSAWQCGADDTGTGSFWALTGNSGTTPGTNFLGTTDAQALELHVNSTRALRLEPNYQGANVIAGYGGNSVTSGEFAATIGGGGLAQDGAGNPAPNLVTGDYGTVSGGVANTAGAAATVGGGVGNYASYYGTAGGGDGNRAEGEFATVGGGRGNLARGDNSTISGGAANRIWGGDYATIAGGGSNATLTSNWVTDDYGTVGGGHDNVAGDDAGTSSDRPYATVSGGDGNTASGGYSTVPGGSENAARGAYSFAAGRKAKGNNDGCFVWGDSTDAALNCNDDNRFIARASGGVYLYTNSGATTGAYLAAGSGSWSSVSDRNLKANFTPVDGQQVLAAVANIPVTTWNYTTEDPSIRHMGPTAQDLHAAFGLGDSDTGISTIDADGVALAAIQGLYEVVQEQDARIQALEARVAALEGGAPLERGSESLLSSIMPFGSLFFVGLFVVGGLVVVQRRRAGGRS